MFVCILTIFNKGYRLKFKILLHTNIPARKTALVRNYFSRHNDYCLDSSLLSSLSANFYLLNTDVLFGKVNHPYLTALYVPYSVSIACLNMNGSEQGWKMQSEIYWSTHGPILTAKFGEDSGDLCSWWEVKNRQVWSFTWSAEQLAHRWPWRNALLLSMVWLRLTGT